MGYSRNFTLLGLIASASIGLNVVLFQQLKLGSTSSEIDGTLHEKTSFFNKLRPWKQENEGKVASDSKKSNWCGVKESVLRETHGPKDVQKLMTMANLDLCSSFQQQHKFLMAKDKVLAWAHSDEEREKELIYGPPGKNLYAIVINDEYAFRHIFKNGGTTVNTLTHSRQIKSNDLGDRSLVAVVRDPIDHFLSGWAECGFRSTNADENPSFSLSYGFDERIGSWVENVQTCLPGSRTKSMGEYCNCVSHSYPQSVYLLDPTTGQSIDPSLELLGSLTELHGMLGIVGLKYDESSRSPVRSASTNPIKVEKYQWDKKLLSNVTLRRICEFVILDYYLFDFEPPSACLDRVMSDVALIENSVVNT